MPPVQVKVLSIAMGMSISPNLFTGYIQNQIFSRLTCSTLELYSCYIADCTSVTLLYFEHLTSSSLLSSTSILISNFLALFPRLPFPNHTLLRSQHLHPVQTHQLTFLRKKSVLSRFLLSSFLSTALYSTVYANPGAITLFLDLV